MGSPACCLLCSVVAGVLLVTSGRADACDRATISGDPRGLSEPWRRELASLVAATADPSQPWGCQQARVGIESREPGALLVVERPGAVRMERALAAPEDLVPVGKALLARAAPAGSALQPGSTRMWADPDEAQADADGEALPPRALIEAAGMVRYAGASEVLVGGAAIRGVLPFDRWSAALWARYGVLMVGLGTPPPDLGVTELAMGLSGAYALVATPVRLDVGLAGSIAVVDMEAEGVSTTPEDHNEVESGTVDGRLGTELRLSVPLSPLWHVMIAADAEVSPASLGDVDRRLDPLLPPIPAYSVGLTTGLEVGIP